RRARRVLTRRNEGRHRDLLKRLDRTFGGRSLAGHTIGAHQRGRQRVAGMVGARPGPKTPAAPVASLVTERSHAASLVSCMTSRRRQRVSIASAVLVEAHIREQIKTGALKRGDRLLPERDLVKPMGVSRTTIRAGLQALATKGV